MEDLNDKNNINIQKSHNELFKSVSVIDIQKTTSE